MLLTCPLLLCTMQAAGQKNRLRSISLGRVLCAENVHDKDAFLSFLSISSFPQD
jgi:hypothetical protein